MNIPDLDNLTSKELQGRWFKKNYPEFYQFLIETYPDLQKFTEKLYWYKYNISEYPKCNCGNILKFINYREGYSKFCSTKCSNSDREKIKSTKITNLERYGVEAPAQNLDILQRMKNTCKRKYGVDNYLKISHRTGQLSESTKQKMKDTCLERYGVENIMKLKEFQDKNKQNKNYQEISKKIWKSRHQNMIDDNDFLSDIQDVWICNCPHPGCNKCIEKTYEVSANIFRDRERDGTEPCTKLLPINSNNNKCTGIELFVHEILDKYNIEYEKNIKNILDGKELDIYIPKKNIAIECNGIFSHCTKYKSPNYHYQKLLECQSKGIRLLTIWEDWIKKKPKITESIILSKLGIYNQRIYARDCTVIKVDSKEACKFLDDNHIQGRTGSRVKIGLYYKDELVSLMTFGYPRIGSGKNEGWDLSRFCNKIDTQVIGGASRLLNWFIKNYQPDIIYSYASTDISDGNLYKKLKFEKHGHTSSYWWIKDNKRYHRSSLTKSSIRRIAHNLGWELSEKWTEKEILYKHRYYQIYDTGMDKYILFNKISK